MKRVMIIAGEASADLHAGKVVRNVLQKDPAVKFDLLKVNWLIGAFQEPWGLHVSVKSPYSTVEDFKKLVDAAHAEKGSHR